MRTKFNMLSGGALIATVTSPAITMAQELDQQSQPEDSNVIIVTAFKKETALSEIPVSIAAVQSEDISALRLNDPTEIAFKVAGVYADPGGGGTVPRWNLRSLGFNSFQPGNGAPVATYYDEVFSPDILGGMPLFDLERVEVVRGPQGTLWGNSTTGGLIHFISKRPEHSFSSGYGEVVVGNKGQRQVEAAVNIPIVDDKLSARFSGFYSAKDSLYFNEFTNQKFPDSDDFAFRAQVLWSPTPDLDLLLSTHFRHLDGNVSTFSSIGRGPNGENSQGYIENPDPFIVSKNARESLENDVEGGFLRASLSLGNGIELVSLTSYDKASDAAFYDGDSSPAWVDQDRMLTDREQGSQELRLSGDFGDLFWTLGGYYYKSTVDSNVSFAANPSRSFFSAQTIFTQDDEYWAMFGQTDFALTDNLSFIGGMRYTEERKDIDFYQVFYTSDPTIDEFESINSPDGVFVNDDLALERKWTKLTWEASLIYKFGDASSIFAKVAKGFRGGNYDSASFGGLNSVDPEDLRSYELGTHLLLFSGDLAFNLTGYYYDLSNAQVTGAGGIGLAFPQDLFNVDGSKVKGFEADFSWDITDALTLSGGYAFSDSSYGPVFTQNALRQIVSIEGNQFILSPRQTGFLGASYEIPVGDNLLEFRTDWRFIGRTYHSFGADSDPYPWNRPAFALGNVQVNYTLPGDRVRLGIFVDNVLDETNYQYASRRTFNGSALVSEYSTRLFGASARFTF